MKQTVFKSAISFLLIAVITLAGTACAASQEDAGKRTRYPAETDTVASVSETTKTPETTKAPLLDGPLHSNSPLIAELKEFDFSTNDPPYPFPLHDLPEGYTYPEGTHPFYIDHGIYLEKDFFRPDLIWSAPVIGSNAETVSPVHLECCSVPFDKDYPDAVYAIQMPAKSDPEVNQAFINCLVGQGWEFVMTKEESDSDPYLIFGATVDQIIDLAENFRSLEDSAGYDFGSVLMTGAYLVNNLYDPNRPIG